MIQKKIQLYLNLIRWDRPAGWLLLLWPTLTALWIAAKGFPSFHLLIVFVLGTILMRSAGCCVNDVADRDFDRYVKRTQNRPVTSGALSTQEALYVGAFLALCSFVLVLTTNFKTILWSFAALIITLIYPYAKRWVSMPQAVLGLAFSFGIPMAFSAVDLKVGLSHLSDLGFGYFLNIDNLKNFHYSSYLNHNTLDIFLLVIANLFWVLAYDTEYAMVDRDDDLKIGMKTSAITLGRFDIIGIASFYILHVLLLIFVLSHYIHASFLSLVTVILIAQVIWHIFLIKDRNRENCFRAFRLNHWMGLTVFVGVFMNYLFL